MPHIASDAQFIVTIMNPTSHVRAQQYDNLPQRAQLASQIMIQQQQRIVAAEQQRIISAQAQIDGYVRRTTARLRQELQGRRLQDPINEAVPTHASQRYAQYSTRIAREQAKHYYASHRPTGRAWTVEPEIEEPDDVQTGATQRDQPISARLVDATADLSNDELEVIDITSEASETEHSPQTNANDEVVCRRRQPHNDTDASLIVRRSEQEEYTSRSREPVRLARTPPSQLSGTHYIRKSKKRSFEIFDEYDPSNYTNGLAESRKRQHIYDFTDEVIDTV